MHVVGYLHPLFGDLNYDLYPITMLLCDLMLSYHSHDTNILFMETLIMICILLPCSLQSYGATILMQTCHIHV